MKTEIMRGGLDLITPCTLVLYQCGCVDVIADALIALPSIDTEYMPLARIADVEDGGPYADHIHDEHGGCRLIGTYGAFSAYCDFLKHYGLMTRGKDGADLEPRP